MTNKNIYWSLGGLDPQLIMKAAPAEKVQKKKVNAWVKWASMAACFCMIVSAIIAIPMLRDLGGINPPISDIPSVSKPMLQEEDPTTIPNTGAEIILPSPPAYSSYHYGSYNDIYKALTDSSDPQFILLRQEQENCGQLYQQTLSDFASGEIKLAVPQINEENMTLRNQEGFHSITWFTSELYNLPWLWYHCLVSEQNLTVGIAYLSVINRDELDSATSYYEVLKMISPNAPSPDNYQESASYQNIYEKEIALGNGKTAIAMIAELKNDSRIYVCLYLDGILVSLLGDEALLTEEFLRTFGIAYIQ